MASITTLSFKLGRTSELPLWDDEGMVKQQESILNWLVLSWDESSSREKKWAETESRVRDSGELGLRFWQAVKRTEGHATTFWRRLWNLP